MSETVILWMAGEFITLVAIIVGAYVVLKDKISEFNMALVQRVTRLEAVLDHIGMKSAKILHSPDDHLGIDTLLDKYLDRDYELTMKEWEMLVKRCEEIESDTTLTQGSRLSAAMLNAVCHHKLGLDPTTDRWWHNKEQK